MGCQIERDFADLLWLDGKDDDIGAAGGVAPLVSLLRDGTDGGKEEAAAALHTLALNAAEHKAAIVTAGAVGVLEELQRGPLAVGLYADASFALYAGGVYHPLAPSYWRRRADIGSCTIRNTVSRRTASSTPARTSRRNRSRWRCQRCGADH